MNTKRSLSLLEEIKKVIMSGRYDKAIVSVVVDKALYSFDNEFDYYLP